MKKRSTRKSSAADLLVSPPTITSPNRSSSESPKHFEFNLGAFNTTSSSKKKKKQNDVASSSDLKTLNTISDLKELASSRLDSIKRQLDRSHSEILKDMEASQSRLHKRFKHAKHRFLSSHSHLRKPLMFFEAIMGFHHLQCNQPYGAATQGDTALVKESVSAKETTIWRLGGGEM